MKKIEKMKKYIEVAEELNKVLGCKPPIDVEEVEKEDLIDDIKEAAAMIDTDEDSISKRTITVLEELGVWINQDEDENEEDEKPIKKDSEPEDEDEDTEEDAEPEDEDEEPEVEEKPKKKKPVKVVKNAAQLKVDFFTPFIEKGKLTKAELIEKGVKEFPKLSKSTLITFLTDAKNPKYNKFKKLIIQNEKGVMTFKNKK